MTIIVSGTTVFNSSAQIDWARITNEPAANMRSLTRTVVGNNSLPDRFNDIVYNYSTGNLTYTVSTDCNCACACSTDTAEP